jgi:uncharacterized protein YcbK (DUF882 family)
MSLEWSKYPNFSAEEFDCSHSGLNLMQPDFMEALQRIRTAYGKPMIITSGYRDVTHPVEAKKELPGWHYAGLAADVACTASEAHEIVRLAMLHGFRGIGVSQRADRARFVHLDMRPGTPVLYGY